MKNPILLGCSAEQPIYIDAAMLNRHGLIAGATGSGKTVSLQVMAEQLSQLGVPVFMADVKGDLSGISQAGKSHPEVDRRQKLMGLENLPFAAMPVLFWDLLGDAGHPLRATISDVGPLLLSSLLDLNETQSGVLYATFRIADDNGMLLLDLKDLRSMLSWVSDNSKSLRGEYGSLSSSSIAAIQRRLLVLEEQKGERFFSEPGLQLQDLMRTDLRGQGVINIMHANEVIHQSPQLYTTFLLWLLSELFENLPETGDSDKPRLVLFFDEAHLIFKNAPKGLLEKVEQVVRLIRSKGVGVFFISQSPTDLPDAVLGQLGTRIQHAMRAFTVRDQKNLKAIAEGFRENPNIDTLEVLTELATGEALVSSLDRKGIPSPVERVLIRPPQSRVGPASDQERMALISNSPIAGRYDQLLDRESAYELLKKRAEVAAEEEPEQTVKKQRSSSSRQTQGVAEAFAKSVVRSFGSQLGRKLVRGLLGSLLGK